MKTALLALVAGLLLTGCASGKEAASSTPAGAVPSPSAAPSEQRPDSHVGDTIADTAGDEFTVYKVAPYKSTNQFEKPSAGNIFIAIDVKERAGSAGLDANPYDFALVMDDDSRYQPTLGYKNPSLHSTKLGAGQAVRGWVTFEVAASGTVARVVLTDSTDIFWDVP